MSRTTLRKELDKLDHKQLVELILDSYDASKDTKEFFEFFLNPDVDALYEKEFNTIIKELNRTKRGMCRARISAVRSTIRHFSSFGVGAEYVGRLMYDTLCLLVGNERHVYYSPTLIKGMHRLATDYLAHANKNGFLLDAVTNIRKMCDDTSLGRESVRADIRATALNSVNSSDFK